jgi:hypothetical protein
MEIEQRCAERNPCSGKKKWEGNDYPDTLIRHDRTGLGTVSFLEDNG